jgi:hypothetical protein
LTKRFCSYDIVTVVVIAAVAVTALWTFKDYAISNDEGVQHHYGELILAYYASGFSDQSIFTFQNLYLYGGLFDVIAVALSHLIPIDPYDLRHILCALAGIGGICATAATARLIAGPRAGLIAAISLSICGAWYGTMFNHTKDVPFAAAMMGASLLLIRIARQLPLPRAGDIAAFGLLVGIALGMRVLGLLLLIYAGFAIVVYLPPIGQGGRTRWHFAIESFSRLLPALVLAYIIMILAWPWAALAPLNPIRGLLAFSEFHYDIRTAFGRSGLRHGRRASALCANLRFDPGAAANLVRCGFCHDIRAAAPRRATALTPTQRKDISLLSITVIFPLACQVIGHGPAFTGLRHFLFVIPPLAVLAGDRS